MTEARGCAWGDDGAHLAVATGHGVALWRLGHELSLRALGESARVDAVAFEGRALWSAGAVELSCHDLATGALIQRGATGFEVLALSTAGRAWVGRRGAAVEVGDFDGRGGAREFVRPDVLAGLDPDEPWKAYVDEEREVRCVAVAPDGRRLVAGYVDGACWMLELPGLEARELRPPDGRMVSAVAWGPRGDVVLVAGAGRFALYGGRGWRARRHDPRATTVFEHVNAVAFSPRAPEVAVASEYFAIDGAVEDLEFISLPSIDKRRDRTHVQIRDLTQRRHIPSARAAAYDPSGRVLGVCKQYGGVSLWDVEAHTYLGTLETFADRSAGLLAYEPYTMGEVGRVELAGEPGRLAALGPNAYGRWAEHCTISSGRGPLAEALGRRLEGGPRTGRG
jgi:WD40 repeat protein